MYYAHSTGRTDRSDWQTLPDHLNAVAELAAVRAARFGMADAGRTAGLLHDLGKYSEPFQQRLAGSNKRVDHATAGARVVKERFPGGVGDLLAYGIAGHHTGMANGRDKGTRSPLQDRLAADIPEVSQGWQRELQLADAPLRPPQGFVQRPERGHFQLAFLARMLFSCLVDADFIETEAFYGRVEHGAVPVRGSHPDLDILRGALNTHLEHLTSSAPATAVNAQRAEILNYARAQAHRTPGHFTMTVPTGGGKTLASLAFALDHAITHSMDRVIYVIPFTSIVEQNAQVFRDALGEFGDTAVLEQHSAFDHEAQKDQLGDDTCAKLRRDSQNWDAPIIVTTAVQFFESLFAAKTSRCRKLHNIARSVVILDEAQTMPLALLRPSVAALDELAQNYHTSVVLCTATQPALEETDEPSRSFEGGLRNLRELAPAPDRLYRQLKRVTARHVGTLEDDALRDELLDIEQVLCIVNNRRHARALFESIADTEGTYHLTTAMCALHRREVLTRIRQALKAGQPCRVISTSLIEAGVDVDFPRVLRAEAGLDSIAQAAGRCNREGKRARQDSEVRIFATANEDWAPPPELTQFAQAARAVLRQYPDTPLEPKAIDAYFRLLYWQQGAQKLDQHGLLKLIENGGLGGLPFETLEQKYRMIENTQLPVIIPYNKHARDTLKRLSYVDTAAGIARELQPYTVQVPRQGFRALEQAGVIAAIEPERFGDQFFVLLDELPGQLNKNVYDDRVGLNWHEPTYRSAESNLW